MKIQSQNIVQKSTPWKLILESRNCFQQKEGHVYWTVEGLYALL